MSAPGTRRPRTGPPEGVMTKRRQGQAEQWSQEQSSQVQVTGNQRANEEKAGGTVEDSSATWLPGDEHPASPLQSVRHAVLLAAGNVTTGQRPPRLPRPTSQNSATEARRRRRSRARRSAATASYSGRPVGSRAVDRYSRSSGSC
jgi:hypothetical protein